jgi:hypothetical protein
MGCGGSSSVSVQSFESKVDPITLAPSPNGNNNGSIKGKGIGSEKGKKSGEMRTIQVATGKNQV